MEVTRRKTHNVHNADGLKKLIAENPDLPLVVLAGDEVNTGDYSYVFCTRVSAEIGEILDCEQDINDEICYTDRDNFEEDIFDQLVNSGEYDDRPDEWYEQEAKRVAAEYDPYWRKCILLTVDN